MEQTEMLRRMQQKTFFKNNGMVLKAVNLLRDKYVSLSDVCYALHPSMNEAEFRDAVNYLTECRIHRLLEGRQQGIVHIGGYRNAGTGSQGHSGRHSNHRLCADRCLH